MVNKKLLISFLLILLVAVSVSAVSAADDVDDIAADDSDVLAAQTIIVDGDDDVAINAAIAEATTGSTIDLGKDKVYDINGNITIDKQIILAGDNVNFLANGSNMPDGVINVYADGSGTTISGITFVNTDDADNYLYKYNGMIDAKGKSVKTSVGIAIDLYAAANNVVIDNCIFNNWFNSAVSINSANNAIVQNSQFYGGSATFINNIPDGPKDRGTYHISAMSSRGTTVINNTFSGTVCDGVSIAGSSFDSTVTGNTFIDNAFSIYFGGKSTEGTLINDNTFINCGWFESDVYDANGTTGETVAFYDLPVISVQKSSESFAIINNTFYARTGNILIAAQEKSTAHGAPSDMGNFTITQNTVLPLNPDVVMHTVILCSLESNIGTLNPTGTMKIINNTLNGAMSATYWSNEWGYNKGDVEIAAAKPMITIMTVDSLSSKKLVGTLKDINGKALTGETISYTIGAVNGTVETDENGVFEIENITGEVTAEFAGDSKLSEATVTCAVPEQRETMIEAENPFTRTAVDYKAGERGYMFYFTLKDTNGTALANKKVKIGIDGKTYTVTTDKDGKAGQMINMPSENSYTYALCFLGDDEYKASFAVSRLVVVKKAVTITPAKTSYTFKTSAKTKTITATLKSTNSYIPKGKQVTLTIAGKTFKATIGDKGQISLNIGSITAKGTYKVAIKFAGTPTYAAASSSTITVKIS